jgi:hypothetical protein
MNGIDNRSFVYAKRVMRLELAELNEMMRLGAGIPGDEYRIGIGIIIGLLGRWHMDVPVEESAHGAKEDVYGHKHASNHYSSRAVAWRRRVVWPGTLVLGCPAVRDALGDARDAAWRRVGGGC